MAIVVQTRQFCCDFANLRWSPSCSSSSSTRGASSSGSGSGSGSGGIGGGDKCSSRRYDVPRITIGHNDDHNSSNTSPSSKHNHNNISEKSAAPSSGTQEQRLPPHVGEDRQQQNRGDTGSSSPTDRHRQHHRDQQRRASSTSFSESSRRLIEAHEEYERQIWRAARDYRQSDHYDYSLFGSSSDLDLAVALHQREAMQYSRGKFSLSERRTKNINPFPHSIRSFVRLFVCSF